MMAVFFGLLCFGILTLWVPERWALSGYQAGMFGVGLWWVAGVMRGRYKVRWNAAAWLAGAPAVWAVAQLAAGRTVDRWQTWNGTLNWGATWLVFVLAVQIGAEPGARRKLLDGLLYFGAGLAAVSTVQMFTSEGKVFWLFPSGYTELVLGPFVYRNQYAAFIETILPLALYRGLRDRRNGVRYLILASVMVASVVAGASRAGTVLVLAEAVAVPLIMAGRGMAGWRAAGSALGQFVVLAAVFLAVVGWEVVWQRFQTPDPYVGRREMLESSVAMARERPGMGFGVGAWATAYPAYALYDDGTFANQAHNDWAQWAVEGGLPLLAAMVGLAGVLVGPAWRSVWGLGIVSVFLHCVVDYPLQQRPMLAGWIFAVAGLIAARGYSKQGPGE